MKNYVHLVRNASFLVLLQGAVGMGVDLPVLANGRCGTWGDSLDLAGAKARVDFALKCEKNARVKAQIKNNFANKIGVEGSAAKREGYPTYGAYSEASQNFENPKKWFAPPTSADGGCKVIPESYEIAFFCAQGCYTPEQGILFLGGKEPIAQARAQGIQEIQILDESSSKGALRLKEGAVERYITDVVEGRQDILEFAMKSGGKLRVTTNHPLVDSEGRMRAANTLAVGESLVKADGTPDAIASITKQEIFGRVYNVGVKSANPKEHVVVAEGYLNGALYYQNEGVKDLNRVLLRTSTTKHLLKD